MSNLSSLSTQSLASCVNYFVWNCLTCFSNTKIGSVTSFSILFNFQGPVSASAMRLTACLFYHRSDFLSSSFFEVFRFLSNLERSRFLGAGRNFRTSIGSFRFTSSWDSEVILLPQHLALKYNTICWATLQAFFISFLLFFRFCIHPLVFCLVSGNVLTFSPFLSIYKSCRTKYRAAAFALWFSFFLPASSPAGSARQPLPALAGRRSDRWA